MVRGYCLVQIEDQEEHHHENKRAAAPRSDETCRARLFVEVLRAEQDHRNKDKLIEDKRD